MAQRFNAHGRPLRAAIPREHLHRRRSALPFVGRRPDGTFVVVWDSTHQDGDTHGIYAQRYNAAGVAQGSEFLVNTTTADAQTYPSVAMDAAGNFVVVWASDQQDGDGWGIFGQRYNAAGVAQGARVPGQHRRRPTTKPIPRWSWTPHGKFVVVWESVGQDGDGVGIYAQRYDATGVAQGGEFRVNSTTAGDQTGAFADMDAAGNFVVAWNSLLPGWQTGLACTPSGSTPPERPKAANSA